MFIPEMGGFIGYTNGQTDVLILNSALRLRRERHVLEPVLDSTINTVIYI